MRLNPQMLQVLQSRAARPTASAPAPRKVTDGEMITAVNRAKMGPAGIGKAPMQQAGPSMGPSIGGATHSFKAGGKVRGCGMAKKGVKKARMY